MRKELAGILTALVYWEDAEAFRYLDFCPKGETSFLTSCPKSGVLRAVWLRRGD